MVKKREDLVGQRFGRLVVVELDEEKTKIKKKTYWICQCDCGNIKSIAASSLKGECTKSCGCLRNEKMRESKIIDLTNKKYGRLTCVNLSYTKQGKSYWKCICDCGNEKIVRSNDLISGKVKSCGCLKKEKIREERLQNLTGKKFGLLTVLSIDYDKTNPPNYYWKCLCECGNFHSVKTSDLNSGNTKSCGCLSKTKSYKCMEIEKFFRENDINYKKEYIFKELKSSSGGYLRFDYAIFDKNNNLQSLIEYNGEQHYKEVPFFGGEKYFNKLCINDKLKIEYCKKHEIDLYIFTYKQPLTEIINILRVIT